jgi:hypothetical protein
MIEVALTSSRSACTAVRHGGNTLVPPACGCSGCSPHGGSESARPRPKRRRACSPLPRLHRCRISVESGRSDRSPDSNRRARVVVIEINLGNFQTKISALLVTFAPAKASFYLPVNRMHPSETGPISTYLTTHPSPAARRRVWGLKSTKNRPTLILLSSVNTVVSGGDPLHTLAFSTLSCVSVWACGPLNLMKITPLTTI